MITDSYTSDGVILDEVTAVYSQEADCCQASDDYQVITFKAVDGGGGKFIRFSTGELGWSLDSLDDFIEIYNDFKRRFEVNQDKSNS